MHPKSETLNGLAIVVIQLLQDHLKHLGFSAAIHFELEGCYQPSTTAFNFDAINQELEKHNIEALLVPEYWQHQWEYVSNFAGQTPLKEAQNLDFALNKLPQIMMANGAQKVLIKPVIWGGGNGKMAQGSLTIISHDPQPIHIPNAIQLNISVSNQQGQNLIASTKLGEYLQQCLLTTSHACCLLYLPEEEAFERLRLKADYGLSQELCSPSDISGGHQGSIALYREIGKHNQKLGEQVLLYGTDNKALISDYQWQKTARIEHRLGASSLMYNPYINVIYGLLNVIDAINLYHHKPALQPAQSPQLPASLHDTNGNLGAISLFEQESWFAENINKIANITNQSTSTNSAIIANNIGNQLKEQVLACYRTTQIQKPL